MRFGVIDILTGHYRTFIGTKSALCLDILFLFVLPISVGVFFLFPQIKATDTLLDVGIASYSIFTALLLSVQVGMYAIFQSDRRKVSDLPEGSTEQKLLIRKRNLLEELNANISYCILFSIASLFILLLLVSMDMNTNIEASIFWALSVHFFFSLVLVLRKAHALFQVEYEQAE